MKLSNKVLLAAGGLIVVALIGVIIATRLLLGGPPATGASGPGADAAQVARSLEARDLRAGVTGGTLELGLRAGARLRPGDPSPRASVKVAALEALKESGALDVDAGGAVNLITYGPIGRESVRRSGVASVQHR